MAEAPRDHVTSPNSSGMVPCQEQGLIYNSSSPSGHKSTRHLLPALLRRNSECGQLCYILFYSAPPPMTDYWWSVDRLATCSASCGNRGVQQPRLRCLLNSTEVNPAHCAGKVRPAVQPIACNRRDCPSR